MLRDFVILFIFRLEVSDQVTNLKLEKDEFAMELKNSNSQMTEITQKNKELKKEQKRIQK